jgi:hypothetical protein
MTGAPSISGRTQKNFHWDEAISIWLAVIFTLSNVCYFLLIPALGLKGQPSQG